MAKHSVEFQRPVAVLVYPFMLDDDTDTPVCSVAVGGRRCTLEPGFTVVGNLFRAVACSKHLPDVVTRAASPLARTRR